MTDKLTDEGQDTPEELLQWKIDRLTEQVQIHSEALKQANHRIASQMDRERRHDSLIEAITSGLTVGELRRIGAYVEINWDEIGD